MIMPGRLCYFVFLIFVASSKKIPLDKIILCQGAIVTSILVANDNKIPKNSDIFKGVILILCKHIALQDGLNSTCTIYKVS